MPLELWKIFKNGHPRKKSTDWAKRFMNPAPKMGQERLRQLGILAHDEIVPRGTIWADEIGNLEAEGQFGPEDWFRLGGLSLKIVPRGTILGRR
jgi:hypothetical protein